MTSNSKTVLLKKMLPYDLGCTLNHAKRVMGNPLLPNVEAEIRKIFRNVQRQLRRYGFSARTNQQKKMRSREFMLSTCWGYRVISVLQGYPKGKPPISFDDVKSIANKVGPRFTSKESVCLTELPKSGGGKRPVIIFGPVARANQHLTRDLILISCGISRYEFARRGRGREALMDKIQNSVKKGGVRALGTLDIKDCFPSIAPSAVAAVVPLSKRIIENSLYIKVGTPIANHADTISHTAVHVGLPQGALSSPVVAGLVIKPCLDKVTAKLCCSFADDVTLGDATVEKVQAQLDTLAAALKSQYPNSPLFEKFSKAFKIGKHANVLGYWVRPNEKKYGGGVRFSPSNTSIRRFYLKLAARLFLESLTKWNSVSRSMAYAFADSQGRWGGKLGGRQMLLTAFWQEIEPLLEEAYQKIKKAKKDGMSGKILTSIIDGELQIAMPVIVLVNKHGLVVWKPKKPK